MSELGESRAWLERIGFTVNDESLWIEAPRVKLDVPPEATLQQPDALYGAL